LRRLLFTIVACFVLIAGAANVEAANVVTGSHGVATSGGSYVFYLGGPMRTVGGERVHSQILRFDISTGVTQPVFTFPDGWSSRRMLQYRGGRLFADMTQSPYADSGAARLWSMDADGKDQREVAATIGLAGDVKNCLPFLDLASISPEGEAIVNLFSAIEFPGSDCAAIKASMSLTAVAADGARTELLSASSPWMAGTSDDVGIGFIFEQGVWGASGNWLLKYDSNGEKLVARDRTTGATYPTSMAGTPDIFQAWPDGSAFMYFRSDCGDCGGFVIPSITKRKAILLDRKKAISDFRVCGDRILELSHPLKVKGDSKASRLSLRDRSGKIVRRLPVKLATNSELADCDANTALLRRLGDGAYPETFLRSSKKHALPELLYTVPLG
jgi:hypothetical protein